MLLSDINELDSNRTATEHLADRPKLTFLPNDMLRTTIADNT